VGGTLGPARIRELAERCVVNRKESMNDQKEGGEAADTYVWERPALQGWSVEQFLNLQKKELIKNE